MKRSIGVVILVLCGCGLASATPLNLTFAALPDLFTNQITGIYNVGTSALTIEGLSVSLQTTAAIPSCASTACSISNSAPLGFGGNFLINASVNSSGNLIAGTDNLTVTGNIATLGDGTPLLTANLDQFGYTTGAQAGVYDFVFTITGGSVASVYGGTGQLLDVIVSDGGANGLPGVFTSSFTTTTLGAADIKAPATPEPASMLLLLSGGGILGLLRKRLRKLSVA